MSTTRELHLGTVVDNVDPEMKGRIKVLCASLMGTDDAGEPVEYPNWIEPVFHWRGSTDGTLGDCGFFFVPSIGVTVELEITGGADHDQSPGMSSLTNPDPRYRGCLLNPGEDIGTEFETNYPNRFGWKAPSGAVFLFDPTVGSEKILIQSHEINGVYSFFAIEHDGSIITATADGCLIYMNATAGTVTIMDAHSNVITTARDGFSLISGSGPIIMAKGANINIMTSGAVNVNASLANLSANKVALGANAAEAVIKGTTFQTLFNAHTHTTSAPAAPTGPPIVPLTGTELSTVVTTA